MDAGPLTAVSVAVANALAEQLSEDDLVILATLLSMIASTLDAIIRLRAIKLLNPNITAETQTDDTLLNI